jgi:hypothetical protein
VIRGGQAGLFARQIRKSTAESRMVQLKNRNCTDVRLKSWKMLIATMTSPEVENLTRARSYQQAVSILFLCLR